MGRRLRRTQYQLEYRIICKDRKIEWVLAKMLSLASWSTMPADK